MARAEIAAGSKPRVGSIPVSRIREDFPILKRSLPSHNGGQPRGLVYLDNAATSQKPRQVLEALDSFYRSRNANVHRALHTLGEEATAAYEGSRCKVQDFIHARSASEIIFTRGTTESINLVAYSWGRKYLKPGDEILLTEMEHHSNLIPWQILAAETGARLRFIPFVRDGTLALDALEQLWSERIRLVAVVHVSNVFGTVNDIRRIIDFAHRRDTPVLVDSAQGVPHLPVDVQELDCDFLAFSGHKTYAPTGVGVLYGKEHWLEQMPPFMGGGEMIRAVWLDRATWNELPHKFEAGTPDIGGAIGLGAALEYLSGLGRENIRRYEEGLTIYALRRLEEVDGLEIYGRAPVRSGVLSFNYPELHPHDIAQFLDWKGIAVRAGHHCAQPLMRKLGIAATVRASLAFYNTAEEIDKLCLGLREAREFFAHGAR